MNNEIKAYNQKQTPADKKICGLLASTIDKVLTEAESKIWHAHPVWFLDGNPVVGYSKLKRQHPSAVLERSRHLMKRN